jgi:hypothetical protein
LIYTALIKAALFAWNYGCPIANPHMDILSLSRNHDLIVDSIVDYFEFVPLPADISAAEGHVHALPVEAAQLAPLFSAIARLHRAVCRSGRECAPDIKGADEYGTAKNLILFFDEQAT